MISFHSGVDCLDVCLWTTKSLFSAACARLSILKYHDILQSEARREARRALLFETESTRHGTFKWCRVKYKVYEKVVLEDSPSTDMDSSFKSFVLLWSVTLLPLEAVNRAEWFVIAAQQGELNPINLLLPSCQFCAALIFLHRIWSTYKQNNNEFFDLFISPVLCALISYWLSTLLHGLSMLPPLWVEGENSSFMCTITPLLGKEGNWKYLPSCKSLALPLARDELNQRSKLCSARWLAL